jgi:hypothetical protein
VIAGVRAERVRGARVTARVEVEPGREVGRFVREVARLCGLKPRDRDRRGREATVTRRRLVHPVRARGGAREDELGARTHSLVRGGVGAEPLRERLSLVPAPEREERERAQEVTAADGVGGGRRPGEAIERSERAARERELEEPSGAREPVLRRRRRDGAAGVSRGAERPGSRPRGQVGGAVAPEGAPGGDGAGDVAGVAPGGAEREPGAWGGPVCRVPREELLVGARRRRGRACDEERVGLAPWRPRCGSGGRRARDLREERCRRSRVPRVEERLRELQLRRGGQRRVVQRGERATEGRRGLREAPRVPER